MQMEWLRAFALLKERMSFSEAAEDMFVSQSSFSKYIKSLENEIGAPLADRSRHRLRITQEGETAYPQICRILKQYDEMLETVRQVSAQQRQRIRIGISPGSSLAVYIRKILDFFRENPKLELQMREYDITLALRLFEAGELDLVIGYAAPELRTGDYDRVLLGEEELLYVGREGSAPQMKAGEPPLCRIAQDRLIVHQNMYQEISSLLERCRSGEKKGAHAVVTTTSMEVLKAYLLGGNARSLLTEADADLIDPFRELLRLRPKEPVVLPLELICKRKELSMEEHRLIERLLHG